MLRALWCMIYTILLTAVIAFRQDGHHGPMAAPAAPSQPEELPETSELQVAETCEAEYKIVERLTWGSIANVYEVYKKTKWWQIKKRQYFALKSLHYHLGADPLAQWEAKREIEVMNATGQCEHVLSLLDGAPCVGGKRRKYDMVTQLMKGDLRRGDFMRGDFKHSTRALGKLPEKCTQPVYQAIRKGLDCVHAAGYIHGDLKSPNVLYGKMGPDGCPEDIKLTGFVHSFKIGKVVQKFLASSYEHSFYLPAAVFVDQNDTLGLSMTAASPVIPIGNSTYPGYVVDPKVDECSLAFLMYELFQERVPNIQKALGIGACGPMGRGRRIHLP